MVHQNSTMDIKPGQSIAFVSGLGGREARGQVRADPWWASIYTASQDAVAGALICNLKLDTASCYFKDITGAVPDMFSLVSKHGQFSESEVSVDGNFTESNTDNANSGDIDTGNIDTGGTNTDVINMEESDLGASDSGGTESSIQSNSDSGSSLFGGSMSLLFLFGLLLLRGVSFVRFRTSPV